MFSYSHVTFVLDAYFYLLKNWPQSQQQTGESNTTDQVKTDKKRAQHPAINDEISQFFSINMDRFDASVFQEKVKAVLGRVNSLNIWSKSDAVEDVQNGDPCIDQRYAFPKCFSCFLVIFYFLFPFLIFSKFFNLLF